MYIYILCISIFIQPMICMSWSSLTAVIFWGTFSMIRCLRWPIKATLLSQSRRTGDHWEPKSAETRFCSFGHRNPMLNNEKTT